MTVLKTMRLFLVLCLVAGAAACGRSSEEAKREYFTRGNAHFDQQKYAEAIVEYRNAIKEDARYGEARYKLAQAYERSGNAARALDEYSRASDLLPENMEAQKKAASYLLRAGRFEDAKTRIQRVLDKDPNNVEAQIIRGNALAGLNDFNGAVNQIEEAIRVEPARGLSYSSLAMLKLAQGQRDEARAAFEKAVEISPDSVAAQMALANFYLSIDDVTQAESTLKRALAIDRKNVMGNRALAALYMRMKRPADAEPLLKTLADATGSASARFALADFYASTQKLVEARSILQPMVADRVTKTGAEARLAEIEYQSGNVQGAHTMLDQALRQDPANANFLLIKARWLIREGKREEALARATEAVKADPKSVAGYYLLGTIQRAAGDRDAAASSFTEVLRLNPRVAAAQVQLSEIQLTQGRTESALQLAESAVENAPDNPTLRLNLARNLIARRDFIRAEPMIRELLEKYPNVAAVYALDGIARLAQKDLTGARRSYTRAFELNASSIEALRGLTTLDVMNKNVPAARARIEARLNAEPNRPELLLLASRFYVGARDAMAAERTLRHLITVAPSEGFGYSLLARVYLQQGRLQTAQDEFDGIVRRNPNDLQALTMGALISELKKNRPDAKLRYQKTLEVNPTAAVAANNLAFLYAEDQEHLDEALRLAEMAVRQLPDRAEAHDTLGWVQYQRELPTLAIPALEQSIAKDPTNPLYHYHLGLVRLKAGDRQKARTSLSRALELAPNFPQAPDARKALASINN